ncbi:MAG: hypothetical protein A3J51_03110 [Omnitrophica WOR_2 bacterium RIFCSPHIGHO2_02_FULL_45_21]|nr:MAG: hypothetical protein A3J51_03110 [Omnitrophica WOR_2 bacterium RIFCSPHIGHO2_02_FULL_45_21]
MKEKKNFKSFEFEAICLAIFVFLAVSVFGQEDEKAVGQRTVMKEVQGEVSWIGKGYISILYSQDVNTGEEYEILLPYDEKDIKLEHRKSIDQIAKGDIVDVHYEEETKQDDYKQEKVKLKAKVVSFVRAAEKKPESTVLTSGEGSREE